MAKYVEISPYTFPHIFPCNLNITHSYKYLGPQRFFSGGNFSLSQPQKWNFIQLSDPKFNFIPLSGKSAVGQNTTSVPRRVSAGHQSNGVIHRTQAYIPKGVHSFRYFLYANPFVTCSCIHVVAVSCGYDTWFAVRLVMDLAVKLSVSAIIYPWWTATHVMIITKEIEERKYLNECTPFGYVSTSFINQHESFN